VALVGIALALLNFGIDEIINPRLRSARDNRKGVKYTLGLTPVLRTAGPAGPGRAPRAATGSAGLPTPVAAASEGKSK
jgi:peptide/nickel transport system permease protein